MREYFCVRNYKTYYRHLLATTSTAALLLTFFFIQPFDFSAVRADTSVAVSLTTSGTTYTENFDTLVSTGTGTLAANTPKGWGFVETGANANNNYTAGTGSSNTGDTFSFGTTAERAFGQLDSGSLLTTLGARFANNTSSTLTSLDIAYTGEQWRSGDTLNVADILDFEYSTDATSLTTGTWTAVNQLDFASVQTTVAAGALNGNLATNRAARSYSISSLNIPNGTTFWIRWVSTNISGSDDGLAIDDFSITPQGGPPVDNAPTVTVTTPVGNATNIAVNANISVTFSEAVTASINSFQIDCATSGSHAFILSGGATTFTLDPTIDFTQGEVCTVTVFAAQVTDQDGTPNNLAQDFVFSFTVINTTPVTIHDIQGSGTASPLINQTVTTSGIVTLLKTGTNNRGAASSFFIQTPDANADADPNTSQGLLVFTGSVPTVAVGDEVTVTGTVVEFNGMTEISPVSSVSLIDTGNPLPTPIALTTTILDPTAAPTQPQLEKYEGMRLSAESLTTVAPNDNFYDVYTVITGVARPLREPGIEISKTVPPDPSSGIVDCCIARWDENPERLLVDTNARAGALLNAYTSLVVFSNIAGPLDFSFDKYRLIPDATLSASANISVVPAPVPTSSEFTVAGTNIENFNNDPIQRAKAALAIKNVLQLPDIIGAIEIFDLADLQALADEIQTISGVTYAPYLIEGDGTTGDNDQDVAFLVKTSRVAVDSVTQELASETFVEPGTSTVAILHDRPPLVLRGRVDPAGVNLPVIAIVNHTRSFIDIDQDPGNGPRVREKRKKQAESIAALFQTLQTNNPTTPIISVGDYNAYQFSDGYTDPLATLKGTPTSDDNIVVDASPDLINPNFFNLTDNLPADQQYSFNFAGTLQALDHILVNRTAYDRRTRNFIIHNNTDFPEVPAGLYKSNTERTEGYSDHDIALAYFSLTAPTAASVYVGGRVVNQTGRGVNNVVITLTDSNGSIRMAKTTSSGYYRFENIEAGGTVILSAKSKRFNFDQPQIVRSVYEEINDADFVTTNFR